jgi:hypothetical protein
MVDAVNLCSCHAIDIGRYRTIVPMRNNLGLRIKCTLLLSRITTATGMSSDISKLFGEPHVTSGQASAPASLALLLSARRLQCEFAVLSIAHVTEVAGGDLLLSRARLCRI